MREESKSEEAADQVEDLDVPADHGEAVKGGIQDGTSNTVMIGEAVPGGATNKPSTNLAKACATGKHFPEVHL